jgi:hypothetical protein
MLKITVHERPEMTTLQLEGKVIGPWVKEFDQVWRSLANSQTVKKVCIDLRDVTQMDLDARLILAEIYKRTRADFLTDTPISEYFAAEARRSQSKHGEEKI